MNKPLLRHMKMTPDTKGILKIGATGLLLMTTVVAFYYSLFWGWASGTGPVDQSHLKLASNVALGVSFVSFWSSVTLWVVPYFRNKKRPSR
mgnify:CR=1 FL=1